MRTGQHLVRYAVVGAFATAAHYLLLVLCVEALQWPAWLGAGLGATLGAQLAYAGNRRFTFTHRRGIAATWPRFMLTAGLGALSSMALVAMGLRLGVHYLIGQAIATLAGLLLTFAINRAWTFR